MDRDGIHRVELFYKEGSTICLDAKTMVMELVEKRDDVLLTMYNIKSRRGFQRAQALGISTVPTTLVNGHRIIRGPPESVEQILEEEKKN